MKSPWLHRCAVLLAVLTLIVVILGASLTSEIRPLPGTESPLTGSSLAGWLTLAAVILEAFLGSMPVLHALLAPVLFSLTVALGVVTSQDWLAAPLLVRSPLGPLRRFSIAVPALVVVQIGLGAAFRHNAMGVISHILTAFVLLVVLLVTGIFVLRQFPDHRSLHPAALATLIIAGVQVLLGFSVYLILLMSAKNNLGLIVTGVMHVANGSLTLAASVVLAMQIQRNIDVTNRSVTST
jgi:heme A synthase